MLPTRCIVFASFSVGCVSTAREELAWVHTRPVFPIGAVSIDTGMSIGVEAVHARRRPCSGGVEVLPGRVAAAPPAVRIAGLDVAGACLATSEGTVAWLDI